MIAAKRAQLDEIVGHLKEEKEEEPEGEELEESDTGSSLLPPLFINLLIKFHFCTCLRFLSLFHDFPSSDDSEEGNEERRPMTKEEEDIDILNSWMEVGGQPALPEGEAQGLLAEVSKFPYLFAFNLPLSIPCFLFFLFATHSSLTILRCRLLLALSSFFVGCETAPACEHEEGGGEETRSRGPAARD